jgi:hypothetical protein
MTKFINSLNSTDYIYTMNYLNFNALIGGVKFAV